MEQTCLTIPKKIHYCWFGGNPLPEDAVKCIQSWKKYCPDYEIIEWNESNFDYRACDYAAEAYEAQKWAFVSDYARFAILYRYGGLYFDTDVELIRPIDDIVEKGPFFGMERTETEEEPVCVAPGLGMGTIASHPIYQAILEVYQKLHFRNSDGTPNQTTIVKYTTDLLKKHGLKDSHHLSCVEGIWIYPWEYFSPMDFYTGMLQTTQNTRSIHHYAATWLTPDELRAKKINLLVSKRLGRKAGHAAERVYSLPHRIYMKYKYTGLSGVARLIWKKVRRKG